MKAGPGSHVSSYFLVTIGTKTRLCSPVELDVALLAIVFQFGMPLNQLARRQNGFDVLRLRKSRPAAAPHHQHDGNGKALAL
jgi:hypothetical protein